MSMAAWHAQKPVRHVEAAGNFFRVVIEQKATTSDNTCNSPSSALKLDCERPVQRNEDCLV